VLGTLGFVREQRVHVRVIHPTIKEIAMTLTETQRLVLEHAAEQPAGRLTWFPDTVKGGARKKVIDGLCNKALITDIGPDASVGQDWFVAPAGYDALGRVPVALPTTHPDPEVEAALVATEALWVAEKADAEAQPVAVKPTRTREHSKQATVIAMLKRPEGATLAQICALTGWQVHTVRGTFAGAFKKKLGLTITSEKAPGGYRVYHVA
jgi:hypothetical protein